jgi:nitrite reductase (NO-forming)
MFVPPLFLVPFEDKKSHGVSYLLLNGGTGGLLIGFGLANRAVIGLSGAAVGLAFLVLAMETWEMVRRSVQRSGLQAWFYGVAVLALVVGIGLAELMVFGTVTPDHVPVVRLAHLHVNLLGFVTLTIVGTAHTLFPTLAETPLYSERLALAAFALLTVGLVGLVSGLLLAEPLVQIGAGGLVLAGTVCYGWNLVGTWLASKTKCSLPVLHVLCASGWLVCTAAGGLFLAWNSRTTPPPVPIGTAHLLGYSHMALVGFILQTIMGALSHLLPVMVALARVRSRKKRGPYVERLASLIESGKWVQLAGLNLGVVAMLGWALAVSFAGLRSELTLAMLGIAAGLLLLALLVFVGTIMRVLASRPGETEGTAS